MRASVFVGTSLDGFLARPNGELDFLDAGGNEPHGYEEFIATVDAIVIGRNTFDVVLGFGTWPYQKPVFVLSTRALPPVPAGARVEQLSGEPRDIVRRLEARGFGHIYVDGGVTIQRFLEAGLIHRLIVTRVSVLIDRSLPLFGPLTRDVLVRHVATRNYGGGLVQTEYEVA